MSEEPELSEVEKRFLEFQRLCKEEEEKYGELLTLVDKHSRFTLPQEQAKRLEEIKNALNQSWDVSIDAFSATETEKRFIWKKVAQNTSLYLAPFVRRQKEFNSALVHLLNEFVGSVNEALAQIRLFHHSLVQYFQSVTPVLDSKIREAISKDEFLLANYSDRLRDHIDLLYQELDRKMEALETEPSAATSDAVKSNVQGGAYFHFEQDFRGTRESIKERFRDYLSDFQNAPAAVLDLGCGRGEFLELMKEAKFSAFGVDSNAHMIKKCREHALEVWQDDLLKFLQSQNDDSLGGIFCSQVVEHVPSGYVLSLLQTAYRKLKKGGKIILETVNVSSAFSFFQVYLRDPTHITPCHPETLKFLVDECGFTNSEIRYRTPVPEGASLQMMNGSGEEEAVAALNENIRRLNRLLFDFQEYAIVAVK